MITRRLDPATDGGAQRLAPGEESLFVDMVPSLRSVAMGKKAGGSPVAEVDDVLEAGLEEVRFKVEILITVTVASNTPPLLRQEKTMPVWACCSRQEQMIMTACFQICNALNG